MSDFVPFWPVAASHHAVVIDRLMIGFSALVIALTAPVFVLIVVYAIRYRRGKPARRSSGTSHGVLIETSWAIIPFLLTVGFFIYSAALFRDLGRPPADALTINAVGKQWMWKFEHSGGQREINDLHVPAGQAVQLVMTSQDVIHSLYLPALRIKQDVLPGRYTRLWFDADRPGVYPLRCAEFCGLDHSQMTGRLFVMRPEDYAVWLAGAGTAGSLASQGEVLFRKLGCSGCHEARATQTAPGLPGVFGQPRPLAGGGMVVADDQYLRDSILRPNDHVVAGYRPIMPSFVGQISEAQMGELVAYLKTESGGVP